MAENRIFIFDTTLRDGEQVPGCKLNTKEKIELASIVLCLADAQNPDSIMEVQEWKKSLQEQYPDKHIITLVNKADLAEAALPGDLNISAKLGSGIGALKTLLVSLVMGDFDIQNETIVASARHFEALKNTIDALEKTSFSLEDSTSADFIAMDIRQAMYHLGTITGDISTDDLLGNIFSKFCIGK